MPEDDFEFPLWMRICNRIGPVRMFYAFAAFCGLLTSLAVICL
jgi:hypothetical protein